MLNKLEKFFIFLEEKEVKGEFSQVLLRELEELKREFYVFYESELEEDEEEKSIYESSFSYIDSQKYLI